MLQPVDVLLVEDNPYDAELLLHALQAVRSIGKTLHVKDGVEALDFLFATGKFVDRDQYDNPKLILLDLKLPKISGFDVLKRIKAHQETRLIPVVILTSSRMESDIRSSYDLGVNSYVVKPVDFDQLQETASELGKYWTKYNYIIIDP